MVFEVVSIRQTGGTLESVSYEYRAIGNRLLSCQTLR